MLVDHSLQLTGGWIDDEAAIRCGGWQRNQNLDYSAFCLRTLWTSARTSWREGSTSGGEGMFSMASSRLISSSCSHCTRFITRLPFFDYLPRRRKRPEGKPSAAMKKDALSVLIESGFPNPSFLLSHLCSF